MRGGGGQDDGWTQGGRVKKATGRREGREEREGREGREWREGRDLDAEEDEERSQLLK